MSLLLAQLSRKTRMTPLKAALWPSCQKRSWGKGACVCAAMKILLLICTFGRCMSQMSGRIKGSVMSFAKVESCSPILPQGVKAAAKSAGESAVSVLGFGARSQRGSVALALEGEPSAPCSRSARCSACEHRPLQESSRGWCFLCPADADTMLGVDSRYANHLGSVVAQTFSWNGAKDFCV